MNRIKSVYRSWAIPCAGTSVYTRRHRAEWLAKLVEGCEFEPNILYQQLDSLEPVRQEARRQLLLESQKHAAVKLLRQIPSIGPIRAALLVALLQTPHRFRSKRQLWAYCGFAVEVHDCGEYRWVRGKLQRNRERITVRGLNDNHNSDLKNLFKGAAISASTRPGLLQDFYLARVAGLRAAVSYVENEYEMSERHACRLLGLGGSTHRYQARRNERDAALRARPKELAAQRMRFQYRRLRARGSASPVQSDFG
jgi:hypothetical protein